MSDLHRDLEHQVRSSKIKSDQMLEKWCSSVPEDSVMDVMFWIGLDWRGFYDERSYLCTPDVINQNTKTPKHIKKEFPVRDFPI